jgi:hypothetical protein
MCCECEFQNTKQSETWFSPAINDLWCHSFATSPNWFLFGGFGKPLTANYLAKALWFWSNGRPNLPVIEDSENWPGFGGHTTRGVIFYDEKPALFFATTTQPWWYLSTEDRLLWLSFKFLVAEPELNKVTTLFLHINVTPFLVELYEKITSVCFRLLSS